MAAWQFKIEFIPKEWAETNAYDSSIIQSADGYSTRLAWSHNQPICNFQEILGEVLPSAKSWNKDLVYWGDTEHDDIQLWYESQNVSSICLRIDMRRNPFRVIPSALEAANRLHCVLFYPEHKTIEPTSEVSIFNAVKNSSAAEFVGLNPVKIDQMWSSREKYSRRLKQL